MVQFFVEDTSFDLSLLSNVNRWLKNVAQQEGAKLNALNYIFTSDEYLLSINQQYLRHNYYTDVITFDQRDNLVAPLEGDIFISLDRVRENATDQQVPFFLELLRVMVHGLLHLIGYHDATDELKQQMRCLEDKYLSLYSNVRDH